MKRSSGNVLKDFGDDEDDHQPFKKKLKNIEITSSESESSDDEAEICAICLGKLYKSQVGSPEGCDHVFCLKCILEWSKNVNTCPVDRIPFQIIFARESIEDNSAVIINVANKDNRLTGEENDVTVCEICGLGDREDRLLLCDGCNKGYHLECLTPPLHQVPHGDWFCEDCEVNSPSHLRSNRMIARTLIYQRVMRNIRRMSHSSDDDDSEDEEEDEHDSEDESEEDVAKHLEDERIHLNPTKKTKSKTKRKKKMFSKKGRSKKKRGSKRRKKKSRRKLKRYIPSMFGESSHSHQNQRFPLEQHALSIFGNRLILHNFKDEIPVSVKPEIQKSTESSATRASKSKEEKKSFDILGDILNGQTLLHSRSSDVAIGRDGTLKPLKPLPDMRLPVDGKSSGNNFFLRDICCSTSSSIPSPSMSSTSSQGSPLFPKSKYPGSSSYSQFSDFSDSSDDSYPSQAGSSYEESYNCLAKDSKTKSKDKTEPGLQKILRSSDKTNLFNKPDEYSPVCSDDNGDDGNRASSEVSKDSCQAVAGQIYDKKEPSIHSIVDNLEVVKANKPLCDITPLKLDQADVSRSPGQSSGISQATASSQSKTEMADPTIECKLKVKEIETSNICISTDIDLSLKNNSNMQIKLESSTCESSVVTSSIVTSSSESKEKTEKEENILLNKDIKDESNDYDDDNDSKMDIDSIDDDDDDDDDGDISNKDNLKSVTINEEKKKLEFVDKLMREGLKSYYLSKQINKEDYKLIMKKGVSKIMKSRDKRIEPEKVKKFVNQYVISVLRKKLQ